jgi:hypothetical protein
MRGRNEKAIDRPKTTDRFSLRVARTRSSTRDKCFHEGNASSSWNSSEENYEKCIKFLTSTPARRRPVCTLVHIPADFVPKPSPIRLTGWV